MPKNPYGSSLLVLVILLAGCRSGKTTTIDFADGSYEGEIDRKGRKDGKGTYRWNDGSTYVGDFKADDRHGLGTFLWGNGQSYKGDYFNDQRTGEGVYRWPEGSYYEGSFLNGKRHGLGTYVGSNGSVYRGEWFDDLQHGEGILTRPDGKRITGVWRNGELVTSPSTLPPAVIPPAGEKPKSRWSDFSDADEAVPTTPVNPASPDPSVAQTPPPPATMSPTSFPTNPSAGSTSGEAEAPGPDDQKVSRIGWFQKEEKSVEPSPPREQPVAPTVGATGDKDLWEGTVEEAELQFVTHIINGKDTIFSKDTGAPFTGTMRVLNADGRAKGQFGVWNGRMHGEEIFFNSRGRVTENHLWSNGKRMR